MDEVVEDDHRFETGHDVDHVLAIAVDLPDRAPDLEAQATAEDPLRLIVMIVAVIVTAVQPKGVHGEVVPRSAVDRQHRSAVAIVGIQALQQQLAGILLQPRPKQHHPLRSTKRTRKRSATRRSRPIPAHRPDIPPTNAPRRKARRNLLPARKSPRRVRNIRRTPIAVVRTPATTTERKRRRTKAKRRRSSDFNQNHLVCIRTMNE